MKVFVTGVHGQLGHDVMEELAKREIIAIGSDISDVDDSYPEYVPLDITDEKSVSVVLSGIRPDAVIHCAAWTAVDAAEDDENRCKVHLVGRVLSRGSLIARIMHRSMYMEKRSWKERLQFRHCWISISS